jgi:hypothetical protein
MLTTVNNMDDNGFGELLVAHRLKDAAGHGVHEATEAHFREQGFFLDTCLRQLVILDASHSSAHRADSEFEWHSGSNAFGFLLQTATGLNSSIPGETNILGQFKQAWQRWREQATPEQVSRLNATMHRLFANSREIRRDYLQGIGGHSYGSLARKLLQPTATANVLFVGAGKLAHSMTSLFSGCATGVWHYRPITETFGKDSLMFTEQSSVEAASWATHMVLTTPANNAIDRMWLEAPYQHIKRIVHLGRRRAEPGVWADLRQNSGPDYFDLDDIFDLRHAQSSARSLQIHRARKACELLATASDQKTNIYLAQSALA